MIKGKINLFGGIQAFRSDQEPIKLRTRQTGLLLAFLVMHPDQEHSRGEIATRLWQDAPSDEKARHSLTMALSSLREGFGEDFDQLFTVGKKTVEARSQSIDIDARTFGQQLQTPSGNRTKTLLAALDLYRGEFLQGIAEPNPEMPWLESYRYRLHVLHQNALAELALLYEEKGDHRGALTYLLKITETDVLLPQYQQALAHIAAAIPLGQSLPPLTPKETTSLKEVEEFLKRLNQAGVQPREEERQLLQRILTETLIRLLDPERRFLIAATIFPDSFTQEQAESVIGYAKTPALIRALRKRNLLLTKEESPHRLYIPIAIRELIAPLLAPEEKRRLQDRLACWLIALMKKPFIIPEVEDLRRATVWQATFEQFQENHNNLDAVLEEQRARGDRRALYRVFKLIKLARKYWADGLGDWTKITNWDGIMLEHIESLPQSQKPLVIQNLGESTGNIPQLPPRIVRLLEKAADGAQFLTKEPRLGHYVSTFAVLAHTAELDQAALSLFAQAYDLIPSDTLESRLRRAWMLISYNVTLQTQGQFQDGLPLLDEAMALVAGTEDAPRVQEFIADALAYQGHYDQAERHYESALDFQFQTDCLAGQMRVLRSVGYCHLHRGQLTRAQISFQHAMNLNPNDRDQVSDCLRGLALVALSRGKLQEAQELLQNGSTVWQEKNHARWQAVFLLHQAQIALLQNDREKTRALLQQAELQIARTKAHASHAYSLYLHGCLSRQENNLPHAVALHTEALELRRKHAAKNLQLDSLEELALALFLSGKPEEAAALFQEAQRERQDLGIPVPAFRQQTTHFLHEKLGTPDPSSVK